MEVGAKLHQDVDGAHLEFVSRVRVHVRISLPTILSPKIMEHQNRTLLSSVRPLTHLLLCTMTIGICSIMAKKP